MHKRRSPRSSDDEIGPSNLASRLRRTTACLKYRLQPCRSVSIVQFAYYGHNQLLQFESEPKVSKYRAARRSRQRCVTFETGDGNSGPA